MKALFFLPFALFLGLVIGGWEPRRALRELRQERDDLAARLEATSRGTRLNALTHMALIPDRARRPVPPADAPEPRQEAGEDAASPVDPAADRATGSQPPGPAPASAPAAEPVQPEDLRARIDEAKELWLTRVQMARAQWIERLNLQPDQVAAFDDAINAMNAELHGSLQRLADHLALNQELTPEIGARALHEVSEIFVRTYDQLAAVQPAAEVSGESARIELTDFVDPAVAEPLIAVQDKVSDAPGARRARGRNR